MIIRCIQILESGIKSIAGSAKDPLVIIGNKFFRSVKDLGDSVVEKEVVPNRMTFRGSWPSMGKQVYDWELEVGGEGRGQYVVMFSMWAASGKYKEGHTFRVNLSTVDRVIPKFVAKYFLPMKNNVKIAVGRGKVD